MKDLEKKIDRIKAMHFSNFMFWVLAKFLFGLGIGLLLAVYFSSAGWAIVGWMLIVFAIILSIPACTTALKKK